MSGEHESNPSRGTSANDQQNSAEQSGQMQQAQQNQDQNQNGQAGADRQQSGQQSADQFDAASRQQQQFDSSGSDRSDGFGDQIREHMEVIGADGAHVGTVDHVDGDRIKLRKADSGAGFGGSHDGHHHYIALSQVSGVHGGQVRLASSGAVAYGMEQES